MPITKPMVNEFNTVLNKETLPLFKYLGKDLYLS